jgi:hypothetical protein
LIRLRLGPIPKEIIVTHSPQSRSVRAATLDFVAGVLAAAPVRLEARVSSREGMPVLCSVESALAQSLPRSAKQELVWLNDRPPSGLSVLRLRAFGADRRLLAEAVLEFAA